jgi:hypothetical protein
VFWYNGMKNSTQKKVDVNANVTKKVTTLYVL